MPFQYLNNIFRPKTINTKKLKERNSTPQDKLLNILNTAKELMYEISINKFNLENTSMLPLFYFIRIMTDYIMYENTVYCIENDDGITKMERTEKPVNDVLLDLFFTADNNMLNESVKKEIKSVYSEKNITINLAKDPVLSFPWESRRLIKTLQHIGSEAENTWDEERNHFCTLHLPMGITEFNSGRHSGFCGMLKREGEIHISSKTKHQILDYSNLYSFIKFDGENYIYIPTGEIAGAAKNFEYGCIYEIGRMMNENGIVFKSIKTKLK